MFRNNKKPKWLNLDDSSENRQRDAANYEISIISQDSFFIYAVANSYFF